MSHDISSKGKVPASHGKPTRLGRWAELFLSSLRQYDPQQFRKLKRRGELEEALQDIDELGRALYRHTLKALLADEAAALNTADREAQVARLSRQAEVLVCESLVVPNPQPAARRSDGSADENTAAWSEGPLLPRPSE